MSMQIGDGAGKGFLVKVFSDLRLAVRAASSSMIDHISAEHGEAYSWTNADYDYDAADTILLVKNTSATTELHVTKAILYSDTGTVVTVHRPTTEVTPTGTAVAGVNLNGNSNNAALATAIGDETDNSQGDVLTSIYLPPNKDVVVDLGGAFILSTNQSIGVDYVTAGTAAIVTIIGYFSDE